jgi:integration host factor subunit beta
MISSAINCSALALSGQLDLCGHNRWLTELSDFLKLPRYHKYFHLEILMNKLELVNALKKECNISKADADAVLRLFFDEMSEALSTGDRVELRGLCSFYVKKYKSYTGRNPKTGEKVKIAPKKLPFFKCGKELRDRVDFD